MDFLLGRKKNCHRPCWEHQRVRHGLISNWERRDELLIINGKMEIQMALIAKLSSPSSALSPCLTHVDCTGHHHDYHPHPTLLTLTYQSNPGPHCAKQLNRTGENHPASLALSLKSQLLGLPWWLQEEESACRCRRHGSDSWSGRIPHAAEQLSPCAMAKSLCSRAGRPQLLSPRVTATEASAPWSPRSARREALWWEAPTPQLGSTLHTTREHPHTTREHPHTTREHPTHH